MCQLYRNALTWVQELCLPQWRHPLFCVGGKSGSQKRGEKGIPGTLKGWWPSISPLRAHPCFYRSENLDAPKKLWGIPQILACSSKSNGVINRFVFHVLCIVILFHFCGTNQSRVCFQTPITAHNYEPKLEKLLECIHRLIIEEIHHPHGKHMAQDLITSNCAQTVPWLLMQIPT